MAKLHTNINRTFDYLDEHFQYTKNGELTIDINYVLSSIETWIDNTQWLIDKVTKDRRSSIEATVFYGFVDMVNNELKHENMYCDNSHIKKWFLKYGMDYKTALSPLVAQYKEERERAIAERKTNK